MMALEVTGNTLARFIQAAVLLHLLDPVRGEPTEHGLDQGAGDVEPQRERLLKRKFLDAVALVCATKKDADTVSAACLEEGSPEGTVVRIASNHGVAARTLLGLRQIMAVLNSVAGGECTASDKEAEVLAMIVHLDIAKIRSYVRCLRDAVSAGSLQPQSTSCSACPVAGFAQWLEQAAAVQDLPAGAAPPESVVWLVQWALEAKRTYLACLKTAFSPPGQPLPRWVYAILKLGRYAVATMALLQLAAEVPRLFSPMGVEALDPPGRIEFALGEDGLPLTAVLRRFASGRVADYAASLGRVWSVADPEAHFRNACALPLRVHAEMQLLNFYAENPSRQPAFRFIGVSKKSCFLCHRFLTSHPLCLSVSSCHQKLYPAWRPPPTVDPPVYRQYKSITAGLSVAMEAIAKQELGDRLGLRRPAPPDSSAGITLSGLTDLVSAAREIQDRRERVPGTKNAAVQIPRPAAPTQSIQVVDLTHAGDDEASLVASEMASSTASAFHVAQMVFHVQRADDSGRQDIIALGDLWEDHGRAPSWVQLLEVLRDDRGVAFKEDEEYLMVNKRIRVASERQFRACVQYLQNAMTWNADVSVHSRGHQEASPLGES